MRLREGCARVSIVLVMVATKLDRETREFNGAQVEPVAAELYAKKIGSGPPVVLLHGGPGAQHDYLLPSFGQLADEFSLYLYDQRGGGRSRVPRPHAIGWRDHVADLERLRRGWGLERQTLLGYSWGGLLALLYGAGRPDAVRALALVAPAAGWGDYHRRFREEFRRRSDSDAIRELREALEASGLRQSDPARYRQRCFDLSVAAYFRDPRSALDSTPFQVQAQAQQSTWASLRGHGPELRRQLKALDVPTLILHGRHDPIPLEWAAELAAAMPAARLVVMEDSGHVPQVEEAKRTFAELRRFLRAHVDR